MIIAIWGEKETKTTFGWEAPILIRESPSQRRTSSGEKKKENDASIACKVPSV